MRGERDEVSAPPPPATFLVHPRHRLRMRSLVPRAHRSSVISALLAALGVAGCASPLARGRAPDAPARARNEGLAPRAARWLVRPSTASRVTELRLEGTLVSAVDTVERVDTLAALLRTTWTHSAPPAGALEIPARISGTLDAYRITFGGSALPEAPTGLALPLVYAAEQRGRDEQPRIALPNAEECTPAAAALSALRELWVSPPDTLQVGLEWADSLQYVTCRDSVTLAVVSVRTYRVIGAEERAGSTVVHVTRRSTTRMSGSGTQLSEPLEITAEGFGEMRLELTLDGGAVVAGTGDAELRMSMRGRRRSQELVQRTRLTIATP